MKRRKFLKHTLAAATVLPAFGGFSMKAFGASTPGLEALVSAAGDSGNVVVVIQLNGGNDGLNTVIPVDQYVMYHYARSNIAIPQNKVLPLNGVSTTGLHPSMTGMQSLYNEGRLSIVQSVGYPSPNFSHFRDSEIWMSASDSDTVVGSGWAGRFLDLYNPGFPNGYPNSTATDPLAIQIGTSTSLVLQGPMVSMGMCINDPTSFYNFINDINDPTPATPEGNELSYLRSVARQTQQYGDVIKNAAARVQSQGAYPDTPLGSQLKIIARLVKGGLKTKVYMASADGFDTHATQPDVHASLLKDLSDAIKAFMDDLKGLGIDDRVIGMTFSEFGRRIVSNDSNGTDHGAAAPMFVFGKNVKPGLVGSNPIIPPNTSNTDNIPFQFDFRSVYASILKDWLCATPAEVQTVLFRGFQPLPLIATSACGVTTPSKAEARKVVAEDAGKHLTNYPNPFVQSTTITFKTKGGHTSLQIIDGAGRVVDILTDKNYVAGTVRMDFESEGLPAGVYYARLQNGSDSQIISMLKVKP